MVIEARPPYDPALVEGMTALKQWFECEPLTPATIPSYRERYRAAQPSVDVLIGGRPVLFEDRVAINPADGTEVTLLVLRPADGRTSGAGIYAIHGGGMIFGSRAGAVLPLIDYVASDGAVVVSVEYRLAPEHPHPAPVEDCYAGLVWLAEHAAELGVDPARMLVTGTSAGGGLAAAVALLARDRGGPAPAGQCLVSAMLDDRLDSVSARQFDSEHGITICDRTFTGAAWTALLGTGAPGGPEVSPYAAPARAADLRGLPAAFVEVAECEVLRDEGVAYASRIWAAGGQAELHAWTGGFHGFPDVVPGAAVSRAAVAARDAWTRRVLGLPAAGLPAA